MCLSRSCGVICHTNHPSAKLRPSLAAALVRAEGAGSSSFKNFHPQMWLSMDPVDTRVAVVWRWMRLLMQCDTSTQRLPLKHQ